MYIWYDLSVPFHVHQEDIVKEREVLGIGKLRIFSVFMLWRGDPVERYQKTPQGIYPVIFDHKTRSYYLDSEESPFTGDTLAELSHVAECAYPFQSEVSLHV